MKDVNPYADPYTKIQTLRENLEAAEARCARLQQALGVYADARHWGIDRDEFRHPRCVWIGPHADQRVPDGGGVAREALAGPDTPADSQEDSQ